MRPAALRVESPLVAHREAAPVDDRQWRVRLSTYVLGGDAATWVTAPLIYSMLFPFVLLDVWVSIFQAICFRAWGVRAVRRDDYFVIDRHRLAYLNGLEKMNCLFCSYANGLLAYVGEIAARTEQYWCPIKHARRGRGRHPRYRWFARYGDARGYRAGLPRLRGALKR